MDLERSDALLLDLLKERKNIASFLDQIFGFLARRTDFYHKMEGPDDSLGFPPGVNEQIVLSAFRKYKKITETPQAAAAATSGPMFVAEEVEVTSDPPKKPPTTKFQPSEFYNGASFDIYCWSQNLKEIEVTVLLPDRITSSKQLEIVLKATELIVGERGRPEAILEGQLSGKAKSSSITWSISGRKLQISFDKQEERWWPQLLVSESPINLQRVDSTRPVDELSESEQNVLERLRWDQERKQQGLPTSQELENQALLKAAWNAEGSPFRGQEFDPSLVQFQ